MKIVGKPARSAQSIDSVTQTLGDDAVSDHHMMPGLEERLTQLFNSPRKRTLTIRGAAREAKVKEVYMLTALVRGMQRQIDDLRSMSGYRRCA